MQFIRAGFLCQENNLRGVMFIAGKMKTCVEILSKINSFHEHRIGC
jgi:hypothetical protein